MPKRFTPFQKLVLHIQRQLTSGHEVKESKLLRHHLTGDMREVDVVIRTQVGEHPITISIECMEHGRRAPVTWVEQMAKKHEHLPTNRLVLVSLSGFSQKARRLAAELDIEVYSPDEAVNVDWTQVVGRCDIFVARFDFTPIWTDLRIVANGIEQLIRAGDPTPLVTENGQPYCLLGELVQLAIQSEVFANPAMDKLVREGEGTATFTFTINTSVSAMDTAARVHRVLEFRTHMKCARRTAKVPLRSLSWRGTPAAFGQGTTALGRTVITLIEVAPGQLDATMTVDGQPLELKPVPKT